MNKTEELELNLPEPEDFFDIQHQNENAEIIDKKIAEITSLLSDKAETNGSNASGNWNINITGNAKTATKATQDGNGKEISKTYLPLKGGTMDKGASIIVPYNVNDDRYTEITGDAIRNYLPSNTGYAGGLNWHDQSKNLLGSIGLYGSKGIPEYYFVGSYSDPFVKVDMEGNTTIKKKLTVSNGVSVSGTSIINYLTTLFVHKSDNTGYPSYLLAFDITNWYLNGSSAKNGFNGHVYSDRGGGHMSQEEVATVIMDCGYSKSTTIGSTLRLSTSNSNYRPCMIHDTTNDKYYLALKISGMDRNLVFHGRVCGTMSTTQIKATDYSGTLPDGYEFVFDPANCTMGMGVSSSCSGNSATATKATQDGSGNVITDTYAKKSVYGDTVVSMGRKSGTTVREKSFAFGDDVTASGDYSCAFGDNAKATGEHSHAQGYLVEASGDYSYAEGFETKASGDCSHAEGSDTLSEGECSHAEGRGTRASEYCSHAEGFETEATGDYSHAEGEGTTASGDYSHAEGFETYAGGDYSHAEGGKAYASGYYSHAEGYNTEAKEDYSHAEGRDTTALTNQHAQGHYNDTTLAKANSEIGTSDGTAFVIGNGTAYSAKSNAFRITGKGVTYAKGAYNSTGADYAEFAEWADGNPNNEDRRGYFVTFDEEKPTMIRKANAGEYILGIVSGNPCIIGNADEGWLGKYVFDEFGGIVYEDVEIEETYTAETGEEKTRTVKVNTYKINPDYDPTKEYVHREKRKEWDAIGWIGVLSVRDDGSCIVGGYCKCADGGIATACEKGEGYRVIKRISDNIIKVVLK